ncbi:hypothetical protein ACJX0J_021521, partial [Zea mays]
AWTGVLSMDILTLKFNQCYLHYFIEAICFKLLVLGVYIGVVQLMHHVSVINLRFVGCGCISEIFEIRAYVIKGNTFLYNRTILRDTSYIARTCMEIDTAMQESIISMNMFRSFSCALYIKSQVSNHVKKSLQARNGSTQKKGNHCCACYVYIIIYNEIDLLAEETSENKIVDFHISLGFGHILSSHVEQNNVEAGKKMKRQRGGK